MRRIRDHFLGALAVLGLLLGSQLARAEAPPPHQPETSSQADLAVGPLDGLRGETLAAHAKAWVAAAVAQESYHRSFSMAPDAESKANILAQINGAMRRTAEQAALAR